MSITERHKELVRVALQSWESAHTYDNFQMLRDKYALLLGTALWCTDEEVNALAIDAFPKFYWAGVETNAYVETHIYEKVVDFFLQDNNISKLTNKEDGENALAGFCCDQAVSFLYGSNLEQRKKLNELLLKWTNKNIDIEQKSLISQVVSILYGSACWDLYGDDTTVDSELMGIVDTIMAAKLPFAFKNQDVPDFENTVLPERLANNL